MECGILKKIRCETDKGYTMNSSPAKRVVVKDGRTIAELGKEIKSAHDLYCALRDLGATRKDIRAITKMRESLQTMLYQVRGIPLEVGDPVWDLLMNLDADHGIPSG
jgi:hypothetical protein